MNHKKPLLIFALLIAFAMLAAIDLPFYAGWQSLNSIDYDAAQTGKEYSWDQLYRAKFGIRPLSWENARFSLCLDTEQFFTETHIRLKEIELGYQLENWYFAARSRQHGHGSGFQMNQRPILQQGFDPYNYQNMRLHAFAVHYDSHVLHKNRQTSLELGGNAHNQATAVFNHTCTEHFYRYEFSQELRARDSDRARPVSITALYLDYIAPKPAFHVKGSAALSYFPEWKFQAQDHGLYLQTELEIPVFPHTRLGLGAEYQNPGPPLPQLQRYQLRVDQILGSFCLTPLIELNTINNINLYKYRLLGNYNLTEISKIGIYYEASRSTGANLHHQAGFVLDFMLDFAD